ncbi:MAG: hypothetical protein EBU90_04970 [Proteobacteria bacterium]|nr:hypothetical protein [Pseudomonadota bacterium]
MKITESKLREIIKEEYLRVTPVMPGEIMSEARAMYLAEEIVNEGFFGNVLAGIKGAIKGVGAAGAKAGEKAAGAASSVGGQLAAAAQKLTAPIAAAGKDAAAAIKDIKDAGVKAAAVAASNSIKSSLEKEVKNQVALIIQKEVASGKDEAAAKAEAEAVVANALAAALMGIGGA